MTVEWLAQSSNPIGIVGVVLTLIAYYLLNLNKITSMSKTYLLLNLFGSIMLFYSLMFHWNLSSVCIEIAWMTISVIGIIRYQRLHKLGQTKASNIFLLKDVKKNKEVGESV